MKRLALALLPVIAPFGFADSANPPASFDSTIEFPRLSLRDNEVVVTSPAERPPIARQERVRSKVAPEGLAAMPIVEPDASVDSRMRIVEPDDSIDYKLTVKEPDRPAN